MIDKAGNLASREEAVYKREVLLEVETLKAQLDAEKRMTELAWGFLNTIAKNSVVSENFSKYFSTSSDYNNTRYTTGESGSVTRSVSKE